MNTLCNQVAIQGQADLIGDFALVDDFKQMDKTGKKKFIKDLYLKRLKKLLQYPDNELYRLFVEGNLLKQENGWMKYDKREGIEGGCLKASFDGLCNLFELISKEKQKYPDLNENTGMCFGRRI